MSEDEPTEWVIAYCCDNCHMVQRGHYSPTAGTRGMPECCSRCGNSDTKFTRGSVLCKLEHYGEGGSTHGLLPDSFKESP